MTGRADREAGVWEGEMGNYLDLQVLDPNGEPITGVEVKIG